MAAEAMGTGAMGTGAMGTGAMGELGGSAAAGVAPWAAVEAVGNGNGAAEERNGREAGEERLAEVRMHMHMHVHVHAHAHVHVRMHGGREAGEEQLAEVPDLDRTHQPWALCGPHAHQT